MWVQRYSVWVYRRRYIFSEMSWLIYNRQEDVVVPFSGTLSKVVIKSALLARILKSVKRVLSFSHFLVVRDNVFGEKNSFFSSKKLSSARE